MDKKNALLKILAVDDDEGNLLVLKEILSDDHQLDTSNTGKEALEKIKTAPPDIILLDIMMPEINGFEVLEKVRKSTDLSTITVILLSAKTELHEKLKGYELGANDYLTKPFDGNELKAKINVYATLKKEEEKRKRAENKLIESESRYRTILENIENGYFEVDLDGKLTFINQAFCKILGYTEDELMRIDNKSYMEKICCMNDESLFDKLKTGERSVVKVIDCELKKKNGTSCFIQSSTTLAKDSAGTVVGLRGVIYDITQRKKQENELKLINDEMLALSETGSLVATVVHDAKKFTTAMSMSIEGLIMPQLKEHLSHDEDWVLELLNDVVEVHTNATRCTKFLESLLNINRKDESIESVDIIDIVQQALSLQSYSLSQNGIEWSIDFDDKAHMQVLGTNQLIRVFMNLIANASDALLKSEVSQPKITITLVEKEKQISVSIHDNGPGIKPDVLNLIRRGIRISTKGKGGNGFGVSGATKIVNQCKGAISIESKIGAGATFIVELPMSTKVSGNPEIEIQLDDSIELF